MELGRYRIVKPLGQGGMATVYLAEDPMLNRLVAIKVIQAHLTSNEKLVERFTVEAKTIASLRHINIVEVFDFGIQGDQQYLVMEFIDGQHLQMLCSAMAGGPLPDTVVAAIICQAAEGLTSAEKHNVVHRDIKPENLLFNSAGVLKIADFGIAHISDDQSRTQTGAVLGSPNYMSPEQVEGLKPSPKTDLFSLGGVFYTCLTGKTPFTGAGIPSTLRNICEKPHPPVVGLNPEADPFLIQLIDTLLQKIPADRGGGANWLAKQLKGWLNGHGIVDAADHVRAFIAGLDFPESPTTAGLGDSEMNSRVERKSTSVPSPKKPPPPSRWRWVGVGAFVLVVATLSVVWNIRKSKRSATDAPISQSVLPAPATPAAVPIPPSPPTLDSISAANSPKQDTSKGIAGAMVGENPASGKTATGPAKVFRKTGLLWIESAPQGAALSIDGKPYDETPMHDWLDIPPGKYRIELAHRLFPPFDTTVTVSPNFKRKFKFRLDR